MPVKHITEKRATGAVLHEEKPFVQVLSSDFKAERCDHCYSNGELLRCSGCAYVRYCDAVCQKAEWPSHKPECNRIKRLPPNKELPNAARLLAKIIMKLKKGGDSEKGYYGKNSFRTFKDLMSHYPHMKSDRKRVEHATSLYGVLTDFLGAENMPNYPQVVGLYGRIVINGFSILDGEMTTLGTGIYLGASTIDHSCSPNAVAIFTGTTLTIKALCDIPNYDWSKVRISYVDCLSLKEERRSDLWSTYYFECDCVRCTDEEEFETAGICQNCRALLSPTYQMNCCNCNWKATDTFLSKYKEAMALSIHQHKQMTNVAYFDACKLCLDKEDGVLHPSNLLHTKTLDLAFEAAIQLKLWNEAVSLGRQLIPGYRVYYGDWHPLTGILFLKLGKILLYKEHEDCLEILREAEKILRVTHGTRHYTYRNLLVHLLHEARGIQ